jgi:polysaccharide export outer membrane protein
MFSAKYLFVIATAAGLVFLASPCVAQTSAGAPSYQTVQPVNQNATAPAAAAFPATHATELILGGGDLIEVSVYGAPEFTKQVRVADNGDISLPLIGTVRVAGLPVHEAELLVEKRLADGGFFNNPQVSIFEKEYATQGISVLGEVQKPGIYPLLGSRRLFDAISAAGGATAKAGNTVTVTRRAGAHDSQTVTFPPNQTFPPESNVDVFPGDTVVVSKAGIVYVVGDVRMPGGFVMENSQMTVLKAIAMAQGANDTAKLQKTVLIRKGNDGPQEIPVALPMIMAAKSPDIQLLADDIVFVPRSAGKAAVRRSLEAILQTATGVAIYRP